LPLLSQRRVRTVPQRSDFVTCLSGGPLSLRTFGLICLPSWGSSNFLLTCTRLTP
jgi:hypothetical protein